MSKIACRHRSEVDGCVSVSFLKIPNQQVEKQQTKQKENKQNEKTSKTRKIETRKPIKK